MARVLAVAYPLLETVTITWDAIQNVDDEYINAASSTSYIVADSEGTTLKSGTLSYVASSDGKWRANVSAITDTDLEGTEGYVQLGLTTSESETGAPRIPVIFTFHGRRC